MTDRDISCEKCNTNLGTIRDARLRKDIKFMCSRCRFAEQEQLSSAKTALAALRLKAKTKPYAGGDFADNFGDIFGDIFSKK